MEILYGHKNWEHLHRRRNKEKEALRGQFQKTDPDGCTANAKIQEREEVMKKIRVNVWGYKEGLLREVLVGSKDDGYYKADDRYTLITTKEYEVQPKTVRKTVQATGGEVNIDSSSRYGDFDSVLPVGDPIPNNAKNILISYDIEEEVK